MNVIDFHKEVDRNLSPETEAVLYRIGTEMGVNAANTIDRMILKAFLKTDYFKPFKEICKP